MHAIAPRHGLEAATGVLAAASIPADTRWFPRETEVAHTAMATSDLTCHADTDPGQWTAEHADVPVSLTGVRGDGTVAVEGVIRVWVTPRR